MTFEEAIKKGQEYGNKLMQNGKVNEALNVLKTEIGVYEDGKPMSFSDLTDSQTDVAIVVMTKLKELCEIHKL